MVKIDLKDAYFTVPLCQEHQTFVRFKLEGTLYEFASLPFGLAPRVFTKIMKPVVAFYNVFGQLTYNGPVKRNSELSCVYNSSSVRELPQVSFNPGHANGIFTLSHRLPNNDPGFTK